MIKVLSVIIIVFFMFSCSNDKNEGYRNFDDEINKQINEVPKTEINIDIPEELEKYTEEKAKLKFPNANRPQSVYGNEDGSVTVGMSLNLHDVSEDELPMFVKSTKDGLTQNLAVQWISDNIETIDNRKFAVLRFFSNSPDGKIYNVIAATSHNGKLGMFTFNCMENQLKEWKQEFDFILKSIELKEPMA